MRLLTDRFMQLTDNYFTMPLPLQCLGWTLKCICLKALLITCCNIFVFFKGSKWNVRTSDIPNIDTEVYEERTAGNVEAPTGAPSDLSYRGYGLNQMDHFLFLKIPNLNSLIEINIGLTSGWNSPYVFSQSLTMPCGMQNKNCQFLNLKLEWVNGFLLGHLAHPMSLSCLVFYFLPRQTSSH